MEIEFIINADGTIQIPRGNVFADSVIKDILCPIIDKEILSSFFHIADNSELFFGDQTLCG